MNPVLIMHVSCYLIGRVAVKYECILCGYIYDPEAGAPELGVAPGTAWEDVPEDFVCPLCGAGKEDFEEF